MLCPHCKDVNLAMTDRQGIEIDYCPTCRGIWLDRGELDRLIERAERESAPPPAPVASAPYREAPPSRDYPKDRGYHHDERYPHGHRKKKSLLGELFDF
jgi:Zn-finger nucleic acid-binding protein